MLTSYMGSLDAHVSVLFLDPAWTSHCVWRGRAGKGLRSANQTASATGDLVVLVA